MFFNNSLAMYNVLKYLDKETLTLLLTINYIKNNYESMIYKLLYKYTYNHCEKDLN